MTYKKPTDRDNVGNTKRPTHSLCQSDRENERNTNRPTNREKERNTKRPTDRERMGKILKGQLADRMR
jgi:hypothetical protein